MRLVYGARLLLLAAATLLTCVPAAGAALLIEQGSEPAQYCTGAAESAEPKVSCLVQFGEPFTINAAIVKMYNFGMPLSTAQVLIARPESEGRWKAIRVSAVPTRWSASYDRGSVETAIAVHPGDRLLIDNPRVVPGAGSAPTFSGTESLSEFDPIAALPEGKILIETDADGDGYGDESQDMCPGVDGFYCQPGAWEIHINGPTNYVPSAAPIEVTWSVTNRASTPQPLLVNIGVPPEATRQDPPGAVCASGFARGFPRLARPGFPTGLVPPSFVRASTPTYGIGGVPWVHCVVPPVAPGATVGGRIRGVWRTPAKTYTAAAVTAVSPYAPGYGADAGTAAVSARLPITHGLNIRPTIGKIGRFDGRGRLPVTAGCPASPGLVVPPCTMRVEVRSAGGRNVLAKAATDAVAPGVQQTMRPRLTAKGKRWLAEHSRSRIDVVTVLSRAGEADVKRTKRVKPKYTRSMRTKLKKLARSKKTARKR